MNLRFFVGPFAALLLAGVASAQAQLIDLSTWQVIQYEFNSQPDASWNLQPGNTAVLQSVNSDASIFLSDFDAAGQEIRGTWRVQTVSDDDYMGFVFGYQGRGQYYLFDWKQADQNAAEGFAERGMTLKAVHTTPGTDPTSFDLWPTLGSANVTTLLHNTIPWEDFVDYEFALVYSAGNIDITVLENDQVLEHWVIADSTYASGPFGFYNYSQGSVLYESFTQQSVPTIYCTAKTNSLGCVPTLTASGSASYSDPGSFDVTAGMLINNKVGMLFYGLNGPAALPFNGGFMCVQPPLLIPSMNNTFGGPPPDDCSGTLTFDFNAWLQNAGAPNVMPGDQIHAQYMYRDRAHLDGTGFGSTEGVEFVVLP